MSIQGTAPSYLADELEYTADFEARRRLRSASTLSLNVRRTRLSTVGDRASSVAAARRLLGTVCHNMTLSRPHPLCLFCKVASRLSSSGVPSCDFHRNFCSAYAVTVVIFGHLNRSFLLTFKSNVWRMACMQEQGLFGGVQYYQAHKVIRFTVLPYLVFILNSNL